MNLRRSFAFIMRVMVLFAFIFNGAVPPAAYAADPHVRFVVTGSTYGQDAGINAEILGEIVQATLDERADFLLVTGNLVAGSSDESQLQAQLTTWRDALQPLYEDGTGVYPLRGDHEASGQAAWDAVFSGDYALPSNGPSGEENRTYSFGLKNVFIIGVNSFANPHAVNQAWLDEQFHTNTREHVFVFGHEPAFKFQNGDVLDDSAPARNAFWRSLTAGGGRVYFAGHDDVYAHARIDDGDGGSDDLHQFIVGTGGAGPSTGGAYNGKNGVWDPQAVYAEATYGYVIVDVSNENVSITWMRRAAPGLYRAGETFSYSLSAAQADEQALPASLQEQALSIPIAYAPPVVSPISNRSDTENDTVSFDVTYSDEDAGQSHTFSAQNLPPGISIDPATGVISGTLAYDAAKDTAYNVIITVLDNGTPPESGLQSFNWTVINKNRQPAVTSVENQSSMEGDLVTLPIQASDLDGDSLTFSQANLPPGLDINATTGEITGTVAVGAAAAAPYPVTITVVDNGTPAPLQNSVSFNWAVAANSGPTLPTIANRTIDEGTTTTIELTAADADASDTLAFSISAGPSFTTLVDHGDRTATLTLTPTYADSGSYPNVTITVTDNGTPPKNTSQHFNITVNNVNRAPAVTNPGAQTSAEGATVNLPISASDPDGDALTYEASGLPGGLAINSSGVITGTIGYAAASTTPYSITVTVKDAALASASTTFDWTVTNTNRPPTITNPGVQASQEGDGVILPVTAGDPDGDGIIYSLAGQPAGLSIDPVSGVIGGTVAYTAAGAPYNVTVTVTEDTTDHLTASASFTWTITDVNQKPSISDPGSQSFAEEAPVSVQIVASDPDDNALSYSAAGLPPNLSINATSGLISGTIANGTGGLGTYKSTITVTDNGTPPESASITVVWTIGSTNHAPTLATPGDQTVAEGQTLTVNLTGVDADGEDTLTFAQTGLPGFAIFTDNHDRTATLTVTPGFANAGTYPMTVTVSDSFGTPASASVYFSIIVTNVNRSPVITKPADQNSAEEVPTSLQIVASDPDTADMGDTLTYAAAGLPGGLAIDTATGLISGTISDGAAAGMPFTVTVTVTDNGTLPLQASTTFNWFVTATNNAPALAAILDQTVAENGVLDFNLTATDADANDTLTFSIENLPTFGTLNDHGDRTATIHFAPGYTAAGVYPNISITVTDNAPTPLSANVTFNLTVTNTNRPPVMGTPGNQTVDEGQVLDVELTATDPDTQDILTISGLDLPAFASVTSTGSGTATLHIAPGYADAGLHEGIVLTVSDGNTPALTDSQTIAITVNNVNQAPVVTNPGNLSSPEEIPVTFAITASDPDGVDTLTYSATGLPDGLGIDTATGVISGTIPDGTAAKPAFAVTVKVTDNGAPSKQTSISFNWTVTATNNQPVLAAIQDKVMDEATGAQIELSAADTDKLDTLAFSISDLEPPSFVSLIDHGDKTATIMLAPDYLDAGDYTVTVMVTDNGAAPASASQSFNIKVNNINRAPALTNPGVQNVAEGSILNVKLTATDPDSDDTLSFVGSNLPSFATLTNNGDRSATLTLAPQYLASGSYPDATITVTDNASEPFSASVSFTINVTNTNQPPVIVDPGTQTLDEMGLLTIPISASDIDGNSIVLEALDLPRFATLTDHLDGTGQIDLSPGYSDAGDYEVTIKATDDGAVPLWGTLTFTISVANVNRLPNIIRPSNKTSYEAHAILLQLKAKDPDQDDTLTFSASGLPLGLNIDPITGRIYGTLSYAASGPYTVTIRVNDGTDSDSEEFKWKIYNTAPSVTWYLAEGNTGADFTTHIPIQNPGNKPAFVTLTYMLEGGVLESRDILIAPQSRYTVSVQDPSQLGTGAAFSTKIESSRFVVAERSMYWPNGDGTTGGHVTAAARRPGKNWYLAEGHTGANYETYIIIQNPSAADAEVVVSYFEEDGTTTERTLVVGANSRYTIRTKDDDQMGPGKTFSTRVKSSKPVVVERTMYFANDGHATMGVTAPKVNWYLAEGYTGGTNDTFISIFNPNSRSAKVTLTYYIEGSGTVIQTLIVNAKSRSTINVRDVEGMGADKAFSTRIASNRPIVVERAMYWANGDGTVAGHDSMGASVKSKIWDLAEGYTGTGFSTYILMMNPGRYEAVVTVKYMLDSGEQIVRVISIPPFSRMTLFANDPGQVGPDQAFSTRIVSNRTIVVERAMYFPNGGSDTIGVNE